MISILILTRDEEVNLPGCLDSVSWSDDVVVFDSGSADATVEIARSRGARVFVRPFDDYGSQREAARGGVEYRNRWVLALDADERPDEELRREMEAVAAAPPGDVVAYRMRRKDHFMGKWIRHATLYPSWFVRFWRPDRVRYETRSVHEYPIVDGEIGALDGHLNHFSFNKGLTDWLAKHNRYSEMEARESLRTLGERGVDWGGLVAWGDPVRRRRAMKEASFRLPMRPLFRFLYMAIGRGGVLDGRAGLTYCTLLAIYEYLIVLKIREQRRRGAGLPV